MAQTFGIMFVIGLAMAASSSLQAIGAVVGLFAIGSIISAIARN